jgi:hypothetical protein
MVQFLSAVASAGPLTTDLLASCGGSVWRVITAPNNS